MALNVHHAHFISLNLILSASLVVLIVKYVDLHKVAINARKAMPLMKWIYVMYYHIVNKINPSHLLLANAIIYQLKVWMDFVSLVWKIKLKLKQTVHLNVITVQFILTIVIFAYLIKNVPNAYLTLFLFLTRTVNVKSQIKLLMMVVVVLLILCMLLLIVHV